MSAASHINITCRELLLALSAGVVYVGPARTAGTDVVRRPRAERVVVLMPALEVVFTVAAQAGGSHAVSDEVEGEVTVTLALATVHLTPAAQLHSLTPLVISGQCQH